MSPATRRLRDLARLLGRRVSLLEVAAALESAAALVTASPRPHPAAQRALLEAAAHALRRAARARPVMTGDAESDARALFEDRRRSFEGPDPALRREEPERVEPRP